MGNHGLTLEGTYYIVGGQELSLPSPFYLHFFLSVHHHLIMFVIVFWCWHNIEDSEKNESAELFRAYLFCSDHHSVYKKKAKMSFTLLCVYFLIRCRLNNTLHTWSMTFLRCRLDVTLHIWPMTFLNLIFFSFHYTGSLYFFSFHHTGRL